MTGNAPPLLRSNMYVYLHFHALAASLLCLLLLFWLYVLVFTIYVTAVRAYTSTGGKAVKLSMSLLSEFKLTHLIIATKNFHFDSYDSRNFMHKKLMVVLTYNRAHQKVNF